MKSSASEIHRPSQCLGILIGAISGLYWDYIGIMEKKMETTIMGYMGIMETKIMETKMKTTILGLRFRVPQKYTFPLFWGSPYQS